jgi:anti-sigma regulatory factor (Ser/Thr protein kinase)
MNGGTGAVWASCGGAHLAHPAEHRSGTGTAFPPWPRETGLPLRALATAPACARGHVRSVAREWGLPELAHTAELLVSELVTNAIRASQRLDVRADLPAAPVVRIWVTSDGLSLAIRVWDASSEMPVRRNGAPDETGGRGLMIVEALSKEWGAYQQDGGKVVWVLIGAS